MPPVVLSRDPNVTESLAREHKLSAEEFARIQATLGRLPTFTELGVFSVMWSEHCSYKSSRVHLKRLPTKGPRVLQGPGENAGVVDIGDGFAAVFKMESHNHPSYIEPYQGAATGVGGILRDVFTMGARPIAALNSLRFGEPGHPRTPSLLRGVVAGIGGYGNCFGVPTVGGEVQFDARYNGNILVNAFTCGVARTDRIFYGRASGVGNPILYVGAKTGRDGIHGATMASDEFAEGGPTQRPTVQVGDPFRGKLLLEACLELFAMDVLEGIQDMGAAGLTSSSVEMGGRADTGVELWLDKVPRRARDMQPFELLLSESQERMLMVAKPGSEHRVEEVCRKWDLDCAVIGRVTDTGRWQVFATPGLDPLAPAPAPESPVLVADLPLDALTEGAPVYDRPRAARLPLAALKTSSIPIPDGSEAWRQAVLALLASPNIGERSWIYRQFDSLVRGGTVVGPGSDAAVVRVPCEREGATLYKLLAFSVDGNGRFVELDPENGAAMIVAESCRNLVCAGAIPIGLTDCLNFGNPERPEVADSLARSIDGIAAACRALSVPIVSGNVSLYNETDGRSILPTPSIGAVGQVMDPAHVTRAAFRAAGRGVYLLGPLFGDESWLEGSEYLVSRIGLSGTGPKIDLAMEARLQACVYECITHGILESAHDVSDGGLAIALAECSSQAEPFVGANVAIEAPSLGLSLLATLFGEASSRVVVSVGAGRERELSDIAARHGISCTRLGETGGDALRLRISCGEEVVEFSLDAEAVAGARRSCLTGIVGE